jgi:hypothetical protein
MFIDIYIYIYICIYIYIYMRLRIVFILRELFPRLWLTETVVI